MSSPTRDPEEDEPCEQDLQTAKDCIMKLSTSSSNNSGGRIDGDSGSDGGKEQSSYTEAITAEEDLCDECGWDPNTFEDEFYALIGDEFSMTMILPNNDPKQFCRAASDNICSYFETNRDCCCLDQLEILANCYFDNDFGKKLVPPCTEPHECRYHDHQDGNDDDNKSNNKEIFEDVGGNGNGTGKIIVGIVVMVSVILVWVTVLWSIFLRKKRSAGSNNNNNNGDEEEQGGQDDNMTISDHSDTDSSNSNASYNKR